MVILHNQMKYTRIWIRWQYTEPISLTIKWTKKPKKKKKGKKEKRKEQFPFNISQRNQLEIINLHPSKKNGTHAFCKQMILHKRTIETNDLVSHEGSGSGSSFGTMADLSSMWETRTAPISLSGNSSVVFACK